MEIIGILVLQAVGLLVCCKLQDLQTKSHIKNCYQADPLHTREWLRGESSKLPDPITED